VLDGDVGAHIGGILAAELEADTDEAFRGGALHRVARRYRAGKGDEIDAVVFDQRQGCLMAEVQVLKHPRWQSRLVEGFGEALRAQRRLRRMLQQHGVTRGQGGNDGVHGRQVGEIPRRDDERHPHGNPAYETGKALFRLHGDIGERFRGDGQHVPGALFETADFSGALGHGPAHLPADLLGDGGFLRDEGIHGAPQDRAALRHRHPPPALPGVAGAA